MKQSNRRSRFVPVELGKIDGTRAVLEAIPEEMTAFGGAPMLAKVEEKVGLVAELSKRVNDSRAQHLVDHKRFDILLQRACQIGLGFADGNDCDWLRDDAGILLGLDRDPLGGQPGASQETVSRFEGKAVNRTNAKVVREIFIDHFVSQQKKRPREIELDCDGTMMKTYGAQEGAVYRGGKYKHTMYFPLKILCGEWLLATVLRRGDQSEARTILAELKMVVGKLRAKWPGLRIKVRLDSAFGSPELYSWLRKERIGYEIGLRPNSVLNLYARAFMEQAEAQFRKVHGEPRFIGKDGDKKAQQEHARIRGLPTEQRMAEEESWRRRRARVVGEFCYKP
ncbi:MAG: transposase, partial [Terriglobia bacterium]